MSSGADSEREALDAEIEASLQGIDLQDIDQQQPGKGAGEQRPPSGFRWGTVVGVDGDDVFVELGPRSQGVCPRAEFDDPPEVGQRLQFTLRGRDDELMLLSRSDVQRLAAWDELEVGSLVKARVSGQNTGGLELKVGPLAAFMPASQVDLRHVEDLSSFIGETFTCQVLELDSGRKRLLLSRRKALESEAAEARGRAASELTPGQILNGEVTRVESFGAFVAIAPGLEGLVHVSNLSRKRVEDPNEFVKIGQNVKVQVLEIKEGGKRIGLGMKQLEPDPWDDIEQRLAPDALINGEVTRLAAFGAFVEIEPGLEGLLHVSQLGQGRVQRPSEFLKVGESVAVRILAIERHAKRISLSRLDRRGALIGSEEAVDDADIDAIIEENSPGGLRTNLGDLFRKALEDE